AGQQAVHHLVVRRVKLGHVGGVRAEAEVQADPACPGVPDQVRDLAVQRNVAAIEERLADLDTSGTGCHGGASRSRFSPRTPLAPRGPAVKSRRSARTSAPDSWL